MKLKKQWIGQIGVFNMEDGYFHVLPARAIKYGGMTGMLKVEFMIVGMKGNQLMITADRNWISEVSSKYVKELIIKK